MTLQEILDELDDHGFTDTGSPRKVSMLNDALQDAASRESWPFLEAQATLTFAGASANAADLPANFARPYSMIRVSDGVELEHKTVKQIDLWGQDLTQDGMPQCWYMIAGVPYFFPRPDSSETVLTRYYRIPTDSDADSPATEPDWPTQHHRVLVMGALYRLYDMEDDPELAVRFQQLYEQRIVNMAYSLLFQQAQSPDIIITDPYFDGDWEG